MFLWFSYVFRHTHDGSWMDPGYEIHLAQPRQRGLQPVRWPKPLADDEKSMASFGEPGGLGGPMGGDPLVIS